MLLKPQERDPAISSAPGRMPSPLPPRQRDPAGLGRLAGTLVALAVLWPLFQAAEVRPGALFAPDNLKVIGSFLAGFLPPETGAEFLGHLGRATLETLAIATAGMALAGLLAVPLAYLASSAGREAATLSRKRRAAPSLAASSKLRFARFLAPLGGRKRRRRFLGALAPLSRILLACLRGIPELVWALLFVRVFGLGPAAGVLALGLTYGGMLGKVYAEILESADPRPARALRQGGAGRLAAIAYGLLPQAAGELVSYTVYRWECAVRASVVMGFVGAGGLGQLMDQAMKMLNGGEAASILITFMALVMAADALSRRLRRRLDRPAPARPAAIGPAGAALGSLLAAAVVASFAFLDIGFAALFTGEAASAMGQFAADFFPPDIAGEWLAKVVRGAWETLAISAVGTLLAAGAGLLLALARPRPLFAFILNALRSVPELVWATLTALAVGLGPFAGALALTLHTAGVLGRLYAEALENTPAAPRRALRLAGAQNGLAFLYGTLPQAAPQLLAYTLYRWEMNIRMAAILGFVGAGGLGQLLYVELSLFHHAQASTVIAAMLLLSVAVDTASGLLRRAWR